MHLSELSLMATGICKMLDISAVTLDLAIRELKTAGTLSEVGHLTQRRRSYDPYEINDIVDKIRGDPTANIDLLAFLAQEDAACAPNLISQIAQQLRLAQPITENNKLCTSAMDAKALVTAVRTYPMAEPGMVAIETIAEHYSTTHFRLKPRNIHNVARGVLAHSAWRPDELTVARRVRRPDDTPGMLTIHYRPAFAKELIARLEKLRARGELSVIL